MPYYIMLKLMMYKPLTNDLKKIFKMFEWLSTVKKSNLNLLKKADGELRRINLEDPNRYVEIDVAIRIISKLCSAIPINIKGRRVLNLKRNFLKFRPTGNLNFFYEATLEHSNTHESCKCYITSISDLTFPVLLDFPKSNFLLY